MWRFDGGTWTSGTVAAVSTPGTHTLEWYSVDRLEHTETVGSATFEVLTRFEQGDARIYYKGPWSTAASGLRSGGSWISLTGTGSAYLTFTGTHIRLMTSTAANMGIARVVLDGGAPHDADLYEAVARHQRHDLGGRRPVGRHPHAARRLDRHQERLLERHQDRHRRLRHHRRPRGRHPVPRPPRRALRPPGSKPTATVSLSATDTGSWVKNTYYRINGSAPATYTVPFTVSAEGTTTVEYWSVDGAGNTETAKTHARCASTRARRPPPTTHRRTGCTDRSRCTWTRPTRRSRCGRHRTTAPTALSPRLAYTGQHRHQRRGHDDGALPRHRRRGQHRGHAQRHGAHRRHRAGVAPTTPRAAGPPAPSCVTLGSTDALSGVTRHRLRARRRTRPDLHGPDHAHAPRARTRSSTPPPTSPATPRPRARPPCASTTRRPFSPTTHRAAGCLAPCS